MSHLPQLPPSLNFGGYPTTTVGHHQFFTTSSPATSPNISISGSNMSPICSDDGPSVSPPLPPRLHPGLHPSDPSSRLPTPGSGGPLGGSDHNQTPTFPGLVGGPGDPSGLAALSAGYPRLGSAAAAGMMAAGLGASMPGLSGYSGDQNPYSSLAMENFYNPLANPYSIKEAGGEGATMPGAWPGSAGGLGGGYYPYADTSSLAAYGYGGAYGLAATRKNVTRESTATLKAWLNEHKKNPYPTKGEKIMLAIISKMTLTQVSCWFANARRRLKKENKMTWEPKNGLNDEDVDVSDEEEGDNSFTREDKPNSLDNEDQRAPSWVVEPSELTNPGSGGDLRSPEGKLLPGIPLPPTKPRIWSMAELAVSKSSYVGCG